MKSKPIKIDVGKLPRRVSQPYQLTKNFNFNIHESRIVIRILQQIKQHQYIEVGQQIDIENNVIMRFRPKDLTVSNDLKLVYKALSTIREKEIILNGKENYEGKEVETRTITGFISEAKYATNNSFVDIKLNLEWYSFLVDLSPGFTPYLANFGFTTSNEYHLAIYQYICNWYKPGKFEGITLNESAIRNNFRITEYSDFRKIIDKVLIPAKKEMDQYADKSFEIHINRLTPGAIRGRGAKIIDVTFKFYQVKKEDTNSGYEPKRAALRIAEVSKIHNLTKQQEAILGALAKKYDLSYLTALEYENRKYLKTQDDFIEAIHKLLSKRK